MTRYRHDIFFIYAQKSFKHVAEALTPLLGTFSWIVSKIYKSNTGKEKITFHI